MSSLCRLPSQAGGSMDYESIPDSAEARVKLLESILLRAIEGKSTPFDDRAYVELRRALSSDPTLKALLPDFVRTCRDLGHFWPYIKEVDPQWAPRRKHVRDKMTPLFDHIEGTHKAPVDAVASDVLQSF